MDTKRSDRGTVDVRRIRGEDLGQALDYAARVYRPNYALFDAKFFDWQFRRTGGRETTVPEGAIGAFQNDEMVGACLVAVHPMLIGGVRAKGGWIYFWFSDTSVPALGVTLLRRALGDLRFLGGAAIETGAVDLFYRLYGKVSWFPMTRLFKPLNPKLAASLYTSLSRDGLLLLGALSSIPGASDIGITDIARFDEHYASIWREASVDFKATADRDDVYMNWRYTDHPRFSYRSVRCTSGAGEAVYVWREEKVGDRLIVARMCEAIGTPAALSKTIPALLARMKADGTALVDFFCSNSSVAVALRAGGMHDVVTRPGFDLPHRLQPPEPYVAKSIDFYFFAPDRDCEVARIDSTQTYFTRGDSNQDAPIVLSGGG